MEDKFVKNCPYCDGIDFIETFHMGYGSVYSKDVLFSGTNLYHVICKNCGSVVRSYVKSTDRLVKKKDKKV